MQDQAELFGIHRSEWAHQENFGKPGLLKKISRAAKKIAKNPLAKVVAGGLAFVVPPLGIAGVAIQAGAIASTANTIIRAGKSKDKQKAAAARKVAQATADLAQKGDPDAKRGLAVLQQAAAKGGDLRAKPPATPARGGSFSRRITWEVSNGQVRRVA